MSVSSSRNEKLLEAGGLLSAKIELPKDVAAEAVAARAYHHPTLGSRPVVLLPDQLFAEAQDLEMEVMGFGPGEDRGVVGQRRRRGLGFPGWAIVNDPEHARFALEVVKEFKKEARRARSKPGHAKTGIDAIGKRLGRSVPHFLPSFYEETGRVFIEAGTSSYAAQYFEKAREAERVHALAGNETERRRSFVEFALAGAVSIKSLSNYAKELATTYSATEAYDHFLELCIQRTLGGMPPWSGMPKELGRLGKAAGKDMTAESEALIEALADAPSLARAAFQFWKAYRKPLLSVAKRSPRVRGALLNLFPSPSPEKEGFDGIWLDLLDECGALDALIDDDSSFPDEARPAGGAATWISRLVSHTSGYERCMPAQGFELLRRVAPRLKAEGKPIKVEGRWGSFDIDFCDLALELGIPVKDPDEELYVYLGDWAEKAEEPERGRDPVSLVADGRFTILLEESLEEVAGERDFERLARGKKGLEELRRSWITRLVQSLSLGGLPDLSSGLERLESSTTVQTFQEFPKAYETLKQCDVRDVLVRTLRGGIIDELGWPALEAAVDELVDPKGKRELLFSGTWPHIIVTDGRKVIVVSPQERVLEHDLQLPKKTDLRDLKYVDSELLVVFRKGYDLKGYWSGSPKHRFEVEGDSWGDLAIGGPAVTLPGGGVCLGERVITVGDTKIPAQSEVISDGVTCWKQEYRQGKHQLVEVDPATGETGRASMPAFFEDFAKEGMEVDIDSSSLLSLPEGVSSTPLGSSDGQVGFRLRLPQRNNPWDDIEDTTGAIEAEGIDGRRFEGRLKRGTPRALLSLPGLERPVPVSGESWNDWSNSFEFDLWNTDGAFRVSRAATEEPSSSRGSACILPLYYWHCLRVRDEKGSVALRSVSEDTTQELLDAARSERRERRERGMEDHERPETTKILSSTITMLTDPRLIRGVVGILDTAAELADRLDETARARDPEGEAAAQEATGIDDEAFRQALDGIVDSDWGEGSLVSQLRALGTLAEGGSIATFPKGSIYFWELLGKIGSLAFKASARGTDDKTRETLLSLLELWAESSFADHPEVCRVLTMNLHKTDIPFALQKDDLVGVGAGVLDGNLYYVRCDDLDEPDTDWTVVEIALSGSFKPLAKGKIQSEQRTTESLTGSERIRQFVALARERGQLHWDESVLELLVEKTGLTRGEAALLWAGLPNLNSWDRDFISKELREEMGLKVTEAERAKDSLRDLDSDKLWSVLGAALPEPFDALWQDSGNAYDENHPTARLAAAWTSSFGRRLNLPEDFVIALQRDVHTDLKPRDALALFADPSSSPSLNTDVAWFVAEHGEVEGKGKKGELAFNSEVLGAVALYIPYLFTELPVGDALRAGIPEVVELVRSRLASTDLLLGTFTIHDYDLKQAKAFVSKLNGEPYVPAGRKKPYKQPSCDTGEVVAIITEWESVSLAIRPARVERWDRVRNLVGDIWFDTTVSPIAAAESLLSKGYESMAARVGKTPVSDGGYEANPSLSIPEIVAKVGATYDIDEDAAVLYLQTLTLAAPTSKKVRLWNSWKPARYKKAGATLVKRKLLVQAKRSRAGRAFFLPGGWEAFSSPYPPIETWKLSLYGIEPAQHGRFEMPLERILPSIPLHELFEKAWKRIEGGDQPAYEEVS